MTYTKAEPIKRYCGSKQVMCELANELGYCKITACVKPSYSPKAYTSNRTKYKDGDGGMTKEEAIYRLKNMAWLYGSTEREQNIKAIDMAIESLERHLDIVRCKDCKHGQYDATHHFCAEHGHKVYEDDFCSQGERKGGEEE